MTRLTQPRNKHQKNLLKIHYRRMEFGFTPGSVTAASTHRTEGTKWMHLIGNLAHRIIRTRPESQWRSFLNMGTTFAEKPTTMLSPPELRGMLKSYVLLAGPGAIEALKHIPLPETTVNDPKADVVVEHVFSDCKPV